ncbi:hypothetical protein GDO86_018945, partial [Hymenochirus boettgeri]
MSHMVTVCGSLKLAQGLWGGTGAWLGVIVCIVALVCQSIHIGNLQVELSMMQKSREELTVKVKTHYNMKQEIVSLYPRQKRQLAGGRKQRHNGNRSFLHLVPGNFSSYESLDTTVISWKVSLKEGRSLDVLGESVIVKNSGIYSIYSQVLYSDNRFTMGHLVTRKMEGDSESDEVLLRCVQSMPSDHSMAYNTCYSA